MHGRCPLQESCCCPDADCQTAMVLQILLLLLLLLIIIIIIAFTVPCVAFACAPQLPHADHACRLPDAVAVHNQMYTAYAAATPLLPAAVLRLLFAGQLQPLSLLHLPAQRVTCMHTASPASWGCCCCCWTACTLSRVSSSRFLSCRRPAA